MTEPDEAWHTLVARLADHEYLLGVRYGEWADAVPINDALLSVTTMAQQEWSHAQMLATLLAQPERFADTAHKRREQVAQRSIPFLRERLQNWVDVVAVNFLFDGALSVIFASAMESSLPAFAAVARSILRDEQMHATFAATWVKRLAGEGGPLAHTLEAAILRIWDETFCWFGPQSAAEADTLYTADVLNAMPDVLRARLLSHVGATSQAVGLHLPLRPAPQGNAWQFTAPLPWERWNATTWQLDPV
jgi:1,2-phenylacetyl-CoA epoxidase catalytic subunit